MKVTCIACKKDFLPKDVVSQFNPLDDDENPHLISFRFDVICRPCYDEMRK